MKRKLDSEKVLLGRKYKASLKEHAEEKLRKEEGAMKMKLDVRVRKLEREFEGKHQKLENALVKRYDVRLRGLSEKEHGLRERRRMFDEKRRNDILKTRREIDIKRQKMGDEVEVERAEMFAKIEAREKKLVVSLVYLFRVVGLSKENLTRLSVT